MSSPNPPHPRSSKRTYWLLVCGVAVFLLLFTVAERLAGPAPGPAGDGSPEDRSEGAGPPPPVVSRRSDGAVEIRFDMLHRPSIRLGNDAAEQALYECLVRRIDETFGNGTSGWTALAMRSEVRRMRIACTEAGQTDSEPPRRDR